MNVILAQPRGFCAGVVRAIDIVELAIEVYHAPIYVFHEIVHNRYVVDQLKQKGAIFVEDLNDVPEQSVCIFSAHGVSNQVVEKARVRQLNVIDATCPLVTKVHLQAQKYINQGYTLIIIGHEGHPEVQGTRGRVDGEVYILSTVEEVQALQVLNVEKLAYVTQTTLSVDETRDVITTLRERFPNIQGPALNDICYATQNRQNAVRDLSKQVDLLFVVGSKNSSNSNRLREVGEIEGITSYLINDANDIQPEWLNNRQKIGITAGASAPEILVQGVIERLQSLGVNTVSVMDGVTENLSFRLPTQLLKTKTTN